MEINKIIYDKNRKIYPYYNGVKGNVRIVDETGEDNELKRFDWSAYGD